MSIAVTFGEPGGVGPEIILSIWTNRKHQLCHPFFVVGDGVFLERCATRLGIKVPIEACEPEVAAQIFPHALPVVSCGGSVCGSPGQPHPNDAGAVLANIDKAVDLTMRGLASALVTGPVCKKSLSAIEPTFNGHTDYIGAIAARYTPHSRVKPVMLLASKCLKVVPITVHIGLAEVSRVLSPELIVRTCLTTNAGLQKWFNMPCPRIAITGLNPHIGEGGTIGNNEEERIIIPAISRLMQLDPQLRVSGPFSADTVYHRAICDEYDVVLAMYHDQALIPIKTIAFHDSINTTLGLPFLRTSPAHGVAFDVAGTGQANPSSFRAAINIAFNCLRNKN